MDNEEVEVVNEKFTQEHTKVYRNPKYGVDAYSVYRNGFKDRIGGVFFQHGPVQVAGVVNGVFNEDLLLMIVDRLEHWQKTEYACQENEEALKHLYGAVDALRARTERRRKKGVLGTHEA